MAYMNNNNNDIHFDKYQFRGFHGDMQRGDWATYVSHDGMTSLVVNLRTGVLAATFTGLDSWSKAGDLAVDNYNADRGWIPVGPS
jgi:hypothetical protein